MTRWTRDGKAHRVGAAGRTRGLVRESFDRDWHTVGSWWLANGVCFRGLGLYGPIVYHLWAGTLWDDGG